MSVPIEEVTQDSGYVCLDFDLQGILFWFHDRTPQQNRVALAASGFYVQWPWAGDIFISNFL